jgi:Trp operon repressor
MEELLADFRQHPEEAVAALLKAAESRSQAGHIRSKPDDMTAVAVSLLPQLQLLKTEKDQRESAEAGTASIEETLEKGGIASTETSYGGHKPFTFVKYEDGTSGVFRSENQDPLLPVERNVAPETYYLRERCAYLVDKALGFNLVPPVVIREINDEVGSIQQFVGAKSYFRTQGEERENYAGLHAQRLEVLRIYDYIIWNSDRHEANLLVDDKDIYAIDNSLSFETLDDPLFLGSFSHEELPEDIVAKVTQFCEDLGLQKELERELFKTGLSITEVDSCLTRIHIIGTLLDRHRRIEPGEEYSLIYRGRDPHYLKRRAA